MDRKEKLLVSQAFGEISKYIKDLGYTVSKNKIYPVIAFARVKFNETTDIESLEQRDAWILNKINLGFVFNPNKKHKKATPPKSSNRNPKIETRASYKRFLKGTYWKEVIVMVLKRDGYKCAKCGNKKRLNVHHKTYEHHLDEKNNLQDLITLCSKCHKEEHGL